MPTAALYCRISRDRDERRAGVERQEQDCRRLAEREGLDVARVYIDNDASAFDGKARQAFGDMLVDAEAGLFDTLIAWHDDRLWRDVVEQTATFRLLASYGVHTVWASRRYDTGSSDDQFSSGLMALVGWKSSADARRRLQRMHQQRAEQGLPSGGGLRPFGYRPGGLELDDIEAALVAEAVDRILAGEGLMAVCRDFNARGITTSRGNRWTTTTLRQMLIGWRIYGIRSHARQPVGRAAWPAIVDPGLRDRVVRMLAKPPQRSTGRRYLLTGVAVCGVCGAGLQGKRQHKRSPKYFCPQGWCVLRDAALLEQWVTGQLLARLRRSQVTSRAGAVPDLLAQLAQRQEQLEELSRAFWVERAMSRDEWQAARQPLERQVEELRGRVSDAQADAAVASFGGTWDGLPFDRRRAVLSALVDRVTVDRTSVKGNGFDPDAIEIRWAR